MFQINKKTVLILAVVVTSSVSSLAQTQSEVICKKTTVTSANGTRGIRYIYSRELREQSCEPEYIEIEKDCSHERQAPVLNCVDTSSVALNQCLVANSQAGFAIQRLSSERDQAQTNYRSASQRVSSLEQQLNNLEIEKRSTPPNRQLKKSNVCFYIHGDDTKNLAEVADQKTCFETGTKLDRLDTFGLNKNISSIYNPDGVTIYFFKERNFEGKRGETKTSIANIGSKSSGFSNFNDEIQSIAIGN